MDALGYDDTLSWAAQTSSGPDTNLAHYPRLMYYYHPDYLGHVEYITDLDGVPYQYFYYTAPMSRLRTSKPMAQRCFSADWSRPLARWGETLIEEKATRPGMHFESPYRFNAKELDEEPTNGSSRTPLKIKDNSEQTGLYYYGARYYNPMVSVWLGVDPLAHISPDKTPYHFVSNNPIMKIDPDGRHDDWVESADGDIYWDDNATSQETTKEGEKYLGKEGTSLNEETGRRVHYKPDGTKNEFDNILSEITINVKNGHVHQTSNPSISTNNKTGYTYNERDLAIRESILSTNNPIATYLRRQESLGNFWILNGRDYWSYYGHTLGNLMLADKYIQMADMVTGGPQPGRLIVPRGIMPGKGSNLPKPNLPSLPDPTGMDNYLRTGSGGIGGM
jgi:RHS repeat-associated protein